MDSPSSPLLNQVRSPITPDQLRGLYLSKFASKDSPSLSKSWMKDGVKSSDPLLFDSPSLKSASKVECQFKTKFATTPKGKKPGRRELFSPGEIFSDPSENESESDEEGEGISPMNGSKKRDDISVTKSGDENDGKCCIVNVTPRRIVTPRKALPRNLDNSETSSEDESILSSSEGDAENECCILRATPMKLKEEVLDSADEDSSCYSSEGESLLSENEAGGFEKLIDTDDECAILSTPSKNEIKREVSGSGIQVHESTPIKVLRALNLDDNINRKNVAENRCDVIRHDTPKGQTPGKLRLFEDSYETDDECNFVSMTSDESNSSLDENQKSVQNDASEENRFVEDIHELGESLTESGVETDCCSIMNSPARKLRKRAQTVQSSPFVRAVKSPEKELYFMECSILNSPAMKMKRGRKTNENLLTAKNESNNDRSEKPTVCSLLENKPIVKTPLRVKVARRSRSVAMKIEENPEEGSVDVKNTENQKQARRRSARRNIELSSEEESIDSDSIATSHHSMARTRSGNRNIGPRNGVDVNTESSKTPHLSSSKKIERNPETGSLNTDTSSTSGKVGRRTRSLTRNIERNFDEENIVIPKAAAKADSRRTEENVVQRNMNSKEGNIDPNSGILNTPRVTRNRGKRLELISVERDRRLVMIVGRSEVGISERNS